MLRNSRLRIHFVNVNHGDAIIIELPELSDNIMRFGVVDFGAKAGSDLSTVTEYLKKLIELRQQGDTNVEFEVSFACCTHPHNDHYGGLTRFIREFASSNPVDNKVRQFWDCGFRVNATNYLNAIDSIAQNDLITFMRLSAGQEFEFGDVRIEVLAPSIDLRNRFDTYGVNKNNASIVLKISFNEAVVILGADAEFYSWAKIVEEFPRDNSITFFEDAVGFAEREEKWDQLRCHILKAAHHGSKNGNSFEYLMRMQPKHVVLTAGEDTWYRDNYPRWRYNFPHHVSTTIFDELNRLHPHTKHLTGTGHIVFKITSPRGIHSQQFNVNPTDPTFLTILQGAI
jgi:beta-lactamase superfamily II metal-dependent hydrolase